MHQMQRAFVLDEMLTLCWTFCLSRAVASCQQLGRQRLLAA